MPTLQERIESATGQVETDAGLLHDVVHGPASGAESTVATDGGAVKTVARAIADLEAAYAAAGVVAAVTAQAETAQSARNEAVAAAAIIPAISADAFIQGNAGGTAWETKTPTQVRTALALGTAALVNTGAASGNVPVLGGDGKLASGVLPSTSGVDPIARDQIAALAFRQFISDALASAVISEGKMFSQIASNELTAVTAGTFVAGAAGTPGYVHNPGTVSTASTSGVWSGATASATFSGDDVAIGTVNRSIYITEGFPDDFSVTFKAIAGSGGGDAFCAFLFRDGARGSFNSTWPNGAMSSVGSSLARILMGQVGGAFTFRDGAYTDLSSGTACASGDTFVVSRSGTTVTFSKNGTAFATWAGVSETLHFGVGTGSGNFDADDVSWVIPGTPVNAEYTTPPGEFLTNPTIVLAYAMYKDDSTTAVLDTDFRVRLSRDGGTTYGYATLASVGTYGSYSIVRSRLDVSGQPSGLNVVADFQWLNSKQQRLAAVYVAKEA